MITESLVCIAVAVYFEARGEPSEGQLAVAQVVRNQHSRVTSTQMKRAKLLSKGITGQGIQSEISASLVFGVMVSRITLETGSCFITPCTLPG